MKHNLISQNLNIKLKLAFQEVLNKHTETINNMYKLNQEAKKFQQAAKKI